MGVGRATLPDLLRAPITQPIRVLDRLPALSQSYTGGVAALAAPGK